MTIQDRLLAAILDTLETDNPKAVRRALADAFQAGALAAKAGRA